MYKITIDDFATVENRVGTVESAEKAEGADKLLRIIFDFGDEKRQIMSAIAEFFPDPSVLVGRQICVCTNLEPRVFRGHESQGMLLAVDNPDGGITFIGPEGKVPAGVRLH